MKFLRSAVLALAALVATPALSAGFVNGGFEAGNASGWDQAGIYRASISNANLGPEDFTIGVGTGRSATIAAGTIDPRVGALFGTTVYGGNFSQRTEDTTFGGNASLLQQRVNNYTDANIFFAWKAVLEGAHGLSNAATMIITLTDLTTSTELIRRQYNAASGGGGVDPRFTLSAGGDYYTASWQIEQLVIGAGLSGHDFLLSVLAADCQPTGHYGYVYLDGFGAVTPPTGGVPEPATWAMMLVGFGIVGTSLRRRRQNARVSFV